MEFKIDVSALQTLAGRFLTADVHAGLEKGMMIATTKLSSYIVQNKLSGQVLNIRTGNLAQSVQTPSPGPSNDFSVTYLVGGKWYGKVHEFGATINVNSPVYLGNDIGWRYLKTVTIPARPWLNPSIQEKIPEMTEDVTKAVREAIKL